ncbi:MAG: hypothetical protein HY652_05265, partial [Acidobacteria bacterium]|nr:hypothetical protein [Acidobacteriota bacterium]
GSFIGHYLERLIYWEISRGALLGVTAALLAWTLFRFFRLRNSNR